MDHLTYGEPGVNYQKKLDAVIKVLEGRQDPPTLLLHSCCGPCSSYVVTYLRDFFKVTVFYYNPNIYPEQEYEHRLSEQTRLLKELGVDLIETGYCHEEFLERVKGLEPEPEGGRRCIECFRLRLSRTAELAGKLGYDYFCTTLTVSPHKNAVVINAVGKELENEVLWLPSDFKKRDGYKRSVELSEKYGLYRQNYCGCEFT